MAMPMKFSRTITDWDQLPVLMDMATTCQLLQCADVTVKKLIQNGHIRGNQIGKKWRIDRESVKEYFCAHPN